MKEQTRKHHGYQPGTSPTHWNFASYSTGDTPISWAHKTVSRSHDSCWISMHWTYCKFSLLFLSFSKAFSFFSLFLPLLMILKMSPFLYFSYLSPLFLVSMFFFTLLFIVPSVPILLLPYYITPNPLPHHPPSLSPPPPPHTP